MLKISYVAMALALVFAMHAESASARGSRGGHIGFGRSSCKTSSCKARHPGGTYLHPVHARKHHR